MTKPTVIFINQVTGPLFRELAEDAADVLGSAVLLTGETGVSPDQVRSGLRVVLGRRYDRRSAIGRISSWLMFFFWSLRHIWSHDRRSVLFIVSNPPFLPLAGWLAARIRGQRYCLLIYDLYPGMLERLRRIRNRGLVAQCWSAFNRMTWKEASVLFTIGDRMEAQVRAELGACSEGPAICVIPNWADTNAVRPRNKAENDFARECGQIGRLTVLYSGNLGASHDVKSIIDAARILRGDERISFLLIGAGEQWSVIKSEVESLGLSNVWMMPFQPEARLPLTLTTGDVAVVSMRSGTEGHMVPSKTYYYMAAGCALLAIVPRDSEVADLAEADGCGLRVEPNDVAGVVAAIRRFADNPDLLDQCRRRARLAAEARFSRANTRKYVDVLQRIVGGR